MMYQYFGYLMYFPMNNSVVGILKFGIFIFGKIIFGNLKFTRQNALEGTLTLHLSLFFTFARYSWPLSKLTWVGHLTHKYSSSLKFGAQDPHLTSWNEKHWQIASFYYFLNFALIKSYFTCLIFIWIDINISIWIN